MQHRGRMSRRQFLALAGASSATVALLAACPAQGPTASDGGEAMEEVEIEFLAWGDVADDPAWATLRDNFNGQDNRITVNVTGVPDPGSNFYTKLQTMFAGGTPPNIASFQGWEWQTYADRDLLAPIDEWVADAGMEYMYPEANTIEVSTKRNGSRYLIPLQMATMVMFYAKKPFDEAGIDYPTDDWTMEDFLETAGGGSF
ncbi:substrate-binding domain-containing protein [Chloroflexi bacterium TSY]|nr:substrate-binding domain-containing protein [Chloroflexi bacterium TSY]